MAAVNAMNDWAVLGLSIGADVDEIKAAHRRLSRLHHPDKGGNKDSFQAMQAAYERLINNSIREVVP